MFRFVFLHTLFSGLCRVRFGRSATLHSHRKTLFIPSKRAAFHSFFSLRKLHFIHSLQVASLAFPAKKLHYTAKNRASPAASRKQSQPSFRYAPFRCIFSAAFKAVYLRCFVLRPRTAPDHPPLKTVEY
jgi:hypothetical protein